MKELFYIITLFILGHFFVNCEKTQPKHVNDYPNDTSISSPQGHPKNSSILYFPYLIKRNDTINRTAIDTITNEWYSYSLYKFNEPILSNFYLGKDIYRFFWLRSFHRPVIITLCKNDNIITLTTKEFSGGAHYFEKRRCMNCDTVNLKDPKLILNETKVLTLDEWVNFENLLNKSDFRNTKPNNGQRGLDGAEWNIEAHLQQEYWFMGRWSPNGDFFKCGEYLIKLSGLKEEVY